MAIIHRLIVGLASAAVPAAWCACGLLAELGCDRLAIDDLLGPRNDPLPLKTSLPAFPCERISEPISEPSPTILAPSLRRPVNGAAFPSPDLLAAAGLPEPAFCGSRYPDSASRSRKLSLNKSPAVDEVLTSRPLSDADSPPFRSISARFPASVSSPLALTVSCSIDTDDPAPSDAPRCDPLPRDDESDWEVPPPARAAASDLGDGECAANLRSASATSAAD